MDRIRLALGDHGVSTPSPGANMVVRLRAPFLWHGNIWSYHNSQHLLDPYSFTHVLHGVVFCGLVWLAFPRIRLVWRLWIASTIEALWEILENTNFII